MIHFFLTFSIVKDEAMRDYFPLPHVLKTVFKLLEDHYNLVFTYTETKVAITGVFVIVPNTRRPRPSPISV